MKPRKPAAEAPEEPKRSRLFSSSNSGVILLFFTGITFGTLAMFTFHQYELRIIQREHDEFRRTAEAWRAAADRESAEATYDKMVGSSLRVVGATRRINESTGQQKTGAGWTGVTQTIVRSEGGKLWRVWSGSFINGTAERIEGVTLKLSAELAGVGEFRRATLTATGPAMGVCAGKNLFCAQPESPLALDAIRGCESAEDLKALIARTLGRPKVRTSVEPGKEIPFVVVQEAQHFQVIPDQLVSLTFTTGPIERLIDRGDAEAAKPRKRRRIKRRKRRRRR